MRLKVLLASAAALASTPLAQPALGATVGLSAENLYLVYEAAVGEVNDLSIVEEPRGVFLITDLNAAITSETTRCISITPNAVRCEFGPDDEPVLEVHAGDGADTVDADTDPSGYALDSIVHGGAGPDTLSATRSSVVFGELGADLLLGGPGPQLLRGGAGADSLDGGAGPDDLWGGAGADVMAGGSGEDWVSYEGRTAPVWISLDDQANDGAAGEGDSVRADVENAIGGRGRTTFSGNGRPNSFIGQDGRDVVRAGGGDDSIFGWGGRDVLAGGAGDDFVEGLDGRDGIAGGPGNDELFGSYGADLIRGGRGNDFLGGDEGVDDLRGGRGRDHLVGGPQNDTLRGGPGRDRLLGDSGADVLYARDRNRERVDGGLGEDRARVDPIDSLFSVEVLF
jgi:Ca2+-binding RTX toxin-like protein